MKKRIIAISILFCLIISLPAYGAATKKINVLMNQVKIIFNSNQLPTDTIIYNNKVYINAADVANALKLDYVWDKKHKTVVIGKLSGVNEKGYARENPANINETVTSNFGNFGSIDYSAEITLKQIVRGTEAFKMYVEANQFNEAPPEGYEYLMAKIHFKLLSGNEIYRLSEYNFNVVSSKGKQSESVTQTVTEPKLSSDLYSGAEHEGWAIFMVEIGDEKPVITFGRTSNGLGGVWIKAY